MCNQSFEHGFSHLSCELFGWTLAAKTDFKAQLKEIQDDCHSMNVETQTWMVLCSCINTPLQLQGEE